MAATDPTEDEGPATQATCELCERVFIADPDAFMEVGLSCEWVKEEAPEVGEVISEEELRGMTAEDLKANGISAADRDALLRGEDVITGAICLCRECRENLFSEEGE